MIKAKRERGFSTVAIVIVALVVGALIGGGLGAVWAFNNLNARLLLKDQPAKISVNQSLPVRARVNNSLDISIDERIRTQVPINKNVSVPVRETLYLKAAIKTQVPVSLNVRVRDTIPIDQVLDLDAVVEAKVLGEVIDIPIRGKVPVRANVPIDLQIPVRENIEVDLVAPVRAVLKQNLMVPLNTVIDAEIPIRSEMTVPVHSEIEADLFLPEEPLDVIINYADLNISLDTLRLNTTDQPTPQRMDDGEVQQ